jgi:hypothetical protein
MTTKTEVTLSKPSEWTAWYEDFVSRAETSKIFDSVDIDRDSPERAVLEAQGFYSGDNYHGIWGTGNWLIDASLSHIRLSVITTSRWGSRCFLPCRVAAWYQQRLLVSRLYQACYLLQLRRFGEAAHKINSCVHSFLSYVLQIILTQYNWRLRRHMLDLM